MIAVDGDGDFGVIGDGGVDDRLEILDVGVFAGALGDLEYAGGFFLGAGFNNRLGQFHVVDVEGANGEPAVVGQIEHGFGCHERHKKPFVL